MTEVVKGAANGLCNRTACQRPLSDEPIHQFMDGNFTGGPRLHYCSECAADFDKWDHQSGRVVRITREPKLMTEVLAPPVGEVLKPVWSVARNLFVRHAEQFCNATRYEEASAIADQAAREFEEIVRGLAAPTVQGGEDLGSSPKSAIPVAAEGEVATLIETIRSRLLGIHPDSQDVVLEDSEWNLILAALEGSA